VALRAVVTLSIDRVVRPADGQLTGQDRGGNKGVAGRVVTGQRGQRRAHRGDGHGRQRVARADECGGEGARAPGATSVDHGDIVGGAVVSVTRMDTSGTTPSEPISTDPAALGMTAHPEGGWYRETWRHQGTVDTPRGRRALATSILFLLRPGEASAWHRVASDELWLWQGGGPVELTLGGAGLAPVGEPAVRLGAGGQHVVPAGVWQRAAPATARATLVGCIVSPGFDFADFQLAEPQS
jgi:predicted cupin superfamily sugar epimerase